MHLTFKIIAVTLLMLPQFIFSQSQEFIFEDEELESRFYTLTNEIRCPKCTSGSIASSNAPIAEDLKRKVYEQILSGKTNDEIKAYIVDRYGEFADYRPSFDSWNLFLWLGPGFFLLIFGYLFFRHQN